MRIRLNGLDSTDAKKLSLLYNWDRDTHDAVLWLRNNRSRFKMEVFEPPILSISVKNPQFAAYAEAGFNAIQMKVNVGRPI